MQSDKYDSEAHRRIYCINTVDISITASTVQVIKFFAEVLYIQVSDTCCRSDQITAVYIDTTVVPRVAARGT